MKHTLVTLTAVLAFVFIVVPLMYIALGKLKNPVDLFALSKIGSSGMLTQKSNFISPNYIPESGSAAKTQSTSESYKKLVEDANNCFNADSIYYTSKEFFSVEKKEGSKLNIKNNQTGTSRFFEGFYPTVETESSISRKPDTIQTNTFIVRPGCAVHNTKPQELLAGFNDAGIFIERLAQDRTGGYDFTNKGVSTINGLTYYWYLFEDQNRLYVRPGDEVFYAAFYSTLLNNSFYASTFEGSSLTFGTSRDFLNQTQAFLAGTVYGTSTTTVYPNTQVNTQANTQMDTSSNPRAGSLQSGGQEGEAQGSASTKAPTTPAKYVPWTPAP